MTTRDDLVDRLREQCSGHPHAKIAWPHRILHEAASALEAANAEIARLTKLIDSYEQDVLGLMKERGEAQSRISDLERQLAAETERCVTTSSRDAYGLFTRQEWFSLPMELRRRWWRKTEYGSKPASDELITEAKTAIRGGAR